MRPQDIKLNEYYCHKDNTGWPKFYIKPIEKLPPKTGINTKTYTIFKCIHTSNKNDSFGLIKYFRAEDLIKF